MLLILAVSLLLACPGSEAGAVFSDLSPVRFIGRWYEVNGTRTHSWGPGIFMLRFRGSSTASVSLSGDDSFFYMCAVDDEPEFRTNPSNGELLIASGLDASKEHTAWCGHSNEGYFGETALHSVSLDIGGELVKLEAQPSELRFEVIGDSISVGFMSRWKLFEPLTYTKTNSDTFDTYERHLADGWATKEWHVVARSGGSVLEMPAWSQVSEQPMAKQWACQSFVPGARSESCAKPWSFEWQADVVVINLGTIDYMYGYPSSAQFTEGYKELISLVRKSYPNALIACLCPLAYSCFGWTNVLFSNPFARMKQAIENAVQQTGDAMVKFYETGSPEAPWLNCLSDYADTYHPLKGGHAKFAGRLLAALTPDIRKLFPSKCGGVGDRCQASGQETGTSVPISTTLTATAHPTATTTLI